MPRQFILARLAACFSTLHNIRNSHAGFEPDSYILSSETRRIASSTTDTRETVAMVTLVIVIVLPAWFFELSASLFFVVHVPMLCTRSRTASSFIYSTVCPTGPPKTPVCVSLIPSMYPTRCKSQKESQKERKGKSIFQLITHEPTQAQNVKCKKPLPPKKSTKKITPFSLDPQNATNSRIMSKKTDKKSLR
jgi:hypothetical protein